MGVLKADMIVDAKGLACPMPIVQTRKAMQTLEAGKVMEVQATDRGSIADLKAWSESVGHYYLGTIEDTDILKHYIRKTRDTDEVEQTFPHTISNEQLAAALQAVEDFLLLDVREKVEFEFSHIPSAYSVPLDQLDQEIETFNKDRPIYIICRSGSRSDLAAKKLEQAGFINVKNVVPGMKDWQEETHGINQ